MTKEQYDKYSDSEYLKFDRIVNKTSNRPDLHAFSLIDKLVPDDSDIVAYAEHDEIWLSVSPEELSKVATEDQIIDLIRCGVRYDDSLDSLALFV